MRFASKLGYALGSVGALAVLAAVPAGAAQTVRTSPLFAGRQAAAHSVPVSASGLPASAQRFVRLGKPQIKGFISPAIMDPGGATAFVSDYNNSVVYVLNAQGQITATLTGFASPDGMATDHSGDLYVTNQGTNSVLELAPPYNSVTATYNDAGEIPLGVAVASNGDVAVTNIFTSSSAAGDVTFFEGGSHTVTHSASSPTFTSPRFCAFDANGDLALDDQDIFNTGAVNVGAVLKGNRNSIITLPTSNTIQFPGGVEISNANKVVVEDQTSLALYTYNYSAGSLTLTATTPLAGAGDPVNFAFTPGSHLALTADFANDVAELYSYPAGGSPLKTVTFPSGAGPIGTAIVPTEQFTLR